MSSFIAMKRIAIVLLLSFMLIGCTTVKGWFSNSEKAAAKAALEPMALEKIAPMVQVKMLWSANVGEGEKRIGTRQGPAVMDGVVYAAAIEGGVKALDLKTGKLLWHKEMKDARISAVGAGDGLVVIGTLSGQVIALDSETGAEKWTAKANNEVIAPPVIGQGYVLVHANDGQILSFQVADGQRSWFWNHEQPALTVRGTSAVALGPGIVFVNNDDGTMSALSLSDGRPLWEQVIGQPEGRSELERMADLDGAPVLDGVTLYASSYKGTTFAIEGPSGRPLWGRDSGGVGGVGLGSSSLAVSDNEGIVWALDKNSGGSLWSNQKLLRRSLTAPAVLGDYAVVGDYEGYVHWLKMEDGELAARERVGSDAILAQPVVADNVLLIQTTGGKLAAFALQ